MIVMKSSLVLFILLLCMSAAEAQVYITRQLANGAMTIERNRNYRCNTPADANSCERDPNMCSGGQSFCEQSESSRWTRYWYTAGTFTSRGAGRNCDEAKRNAVQNLFNNESNLCGSDGQPTCRGGTDGGACYWNGRQIVAWYVCHNDFGGAPTRGNAAVGFVLLEMLRRPRVQR